MGGLAEEFLTFFRYFMKFQLKCKIKRGTENEGMLRGDRCSNFNTRMRSRVDRKADEFQLALLEL